MGWQVCELAGNSGVVSSVAFSLDGKRVVSGSSGGIVTIWDTATGAEVSSFVRLRGGW